MISIFGTEYSVLKSASSTPLFYHSSVVYFEHAESSHGLLLRDVHPWKLLIFNSKLGIEIHYLMTTYLRLRADYPFVLIWSASSNDIWNGLVRLTSFTRDDYEDLIAMMRHVPFRGSNSGKIKITKTCNFSVSTAV